jgi:hypothetical protein
VAISPTPNLPSSTNNSSSNNSIKIATPDLILLDSESLNVDLMADLIFEDIGGQELISISRNDIVNGQQVAYQPIKNLSSLSFKYNPNTLVALQDPSNTFFNNFSIKLEDKIPVSGNGPADTAVYVDNNTGDLVIELVNIAEDEQVEVQILSSGDILDDTIY